LYVQDPSSRAVKPLDTARPKGDYSETDTHTPHTPQPFMDPMLSHLRPPPPPFTFNKRSCWGLTGLCANRKSGYPQYPLFPTCLSSSLRGVPRSLPVLECSYIAHLPFHSTQLPSQPQSGRTWGVCLDAYKRWGLLVNSFLIPNVGLSRRGDRCFSTWVRYDMLCSADAVFCHQRESCFKTAFALCTPLLRLTTLVKQYHHHHHHQSIIIHAPPSPP
jgi:hypothetical protein